MALRYIKYLFFVFFILAIIAPFGCKKNSTAPQVDSLTRPVIWLNTFEMSFAAFKSGGNPEPQILQIKNTGIDTLSYDISCEADWLEVEPTTGTSTGQIKGHEISAKKTGLDARDEPYTTTIKITDTNSYNNPQEIKVSFMVSEEPPPTIGVSPKNLEFSAQQGGSDPPPQTIKIVNTGEGTLKYEIESDANWLNVSPDTGSSKTATKKHTVSCSTHGLKVGTHSGTLKIRDPNATNSPQTVKVSLNVTKEPLPEIWTSTNNVNMEATLGDGSSPSGIFHVKNSGGGTLNYVVDWDASWMLVAPNGGTSSGPERKHTVRTDITGLGVGTHRGTITIRDNKASNSPQYVDVRLTIKDEAPPPTQNRIGPDIKPSSATPGTTVRVEINIGGNVNEIAAFGLNLTYDTSMFQYQNTSSGNLTGGWSVAGGDNNGTVTIGGYKLGNPSISIGSQGTIAVVTLRVTGDSYSNGQQSQISISNYADDIAGMTPQPASGTFTLIK